MSGMPRELEITSDVLQEARATFSERKDNCIEQSRLAIEVLRQLGIKARALPVKVMVLSPVLTAEFKANPNVLNEQCGDVSEEELRERGWVVLAVGVQPGDGTFAGPAPPYPDEAINGWHGHLIVESQGWAVDLTADQFNRPDYGMDELEPVAFEAHRPFMRGQPVEFIYKNCLMTYQRTDDKSFAASPAWRQLRPGDVAIMKLTEVVRNRTRKERRGAARTNP